jgi:YesN/AraC family two-component response regulator
MATGILQTSYENKTLVDMMNYCKRLLSKISCQYGNNDTKEKNYCELAKAYLEQNYMQDMNITDTADHLDISYSYLSKIFRARTGVTLTDYLNNVRIEKSKEYLSNTFLTLTEISEKVGYNNVQSYQRFFKKYVNITPGDYRKLHQNNAENNLL